MGRQRPRLRRTARTKTTSSQQGSLSPRASLGETAEKRKTSLVDEQLRSPGQPLDHATRSFMEASLGHDFSQVRVHADNRAAESNRMLNAEAYTVGNHIAFGAASFNPNSEEGRKLLAHELTHVVQQGARVSSSTNISIADPAHASEAEASRVAENISSAGAFQIPQTRVSNAVLQRAPKKKKKRVDVALVFDDSQNTMAEAGARAKVTVRATSVEDAKQKLATLGEPIGTLHVLSHGSREGEVEIFNEAGDESEWVSISSLGSELNGAFTVGDGPQTVDFSGCKIGEAGDVLEQFREDVGAREAKGNNCWTFTQDATPLTLDDGTEITDASQIPKGMMDVFNERLLEQIAGMTSEDGHPVGNCIVGLGPKEGANKANLKKLKKLYFANEGRLVATWASPDFNETWQEGSMCTKNLTTTTEPCKVVKKKAPKK
jgi:hypothetical protein